MKSNRVFCFTLTMKVEINYYRDDDAHTCLFDIWSFFFFWEGFDIWSWSKIHENYFHFHIWIDKIGYKLYHRILPHMESCNFLQLLVYSQAMSHEHILLIIPINLSKNLLGMFRDKGQKCKISPNVYLWSKPKILNV